jgi:hypothetical protein
MMTGKQKYSRSWHVHCSNGFRTRPLKHRKFPLTSPTTTSRRPLLHHSDSSSQHKTMQKKPTQLLECCWTSSPSGAPASAVCNLIFPKSLGNLRDGEFFEKPSLIILFLKPTLARKTKHGIAGLNYHDD